MLIFCSVSCSFGIFFAHRKTDASSGTPPKDHHDSDAMSSVVTKKRSSGDLTGSEENGLQPKKGRKDYSGKHDSPTNKSPEVVFSLSKTSRMVTRSQKDTFSTEASQPEENTETTSQENHLSSRVEDAPTVLGSNGQNQKKRTNSRHGPSQFELQITKIMTESCQALSKACKKIETNAFAAAQVMNQDFIAAIEKTRTEREKQSSSLLEEKKKEIEDLFKKKCKSLRQSHDERIAVETEMIENLQRKMNAIVNEESKTFQDECSALEEGVKKKLQGSKHSLVCAIIVGETVRIQDAFNNFTEGLEKSPLRLEVQSQKEKLEKLKNIRWQLELALDRETALHDCELKLKREINQMVEQDIPIVVKTVSEQIISSTNRCQEHLDFLDQDLEIDPKDLKDIENIQNEWKTSVEEEERYLKRQYEDEISSSKEELLNQYLSQKASCKALSVLKLGEEEEILSNQLAEVRKNIKQSQASIDDLTSFAVRCRLSSMRRLDNVNELEWKRKQMARLLKVHLDTDKKMSFKPPAVTEVSSEQTSDKQECAEKMLKELTPQETEELFSDWQE